MILRRHDKFQLGNSAEASLWISPYLFTFHVYAIKKKYGWYKPRRIDMFLITRLNAKSFAKEIVDGFSICHTVDLSNSHFLTRLCNISKEIHENLIQDKFTIRTSFLILKNFYWIKFWDKLLLNELFCFTRFNGIFGYFAFWETNFWELSKAVFKNFLPQLGPELDPPPRQKVVNFFRWE